MPAGPEQSDAEAEQILQELSNDLMSPYCPGRTIASCPSKNARELEDHILAEAKTGKTRDQIEHQLVSRFGTDIIGYKPPPLVLYGTIAGGALALGLLIVAGRRWVRKARLPSMITPPRGSSFGGEGATVAVGAAAGAAAVAATVASPAGPEPTRTELDALDDALDDEDGF